MNRSPESITLRRDHTAVTIAPQRGAIVTSFRVRERELLYLDQATFNDRSKNVRGGIPVLFPSPGKLVDDRWHCAGKRGELKQHGFARNMEWQLDSEVKATSATLAIEANDATLHNYPWKFRATLAFELEADALTMRFVIENRDTTAMPFALGLHPYFAVSDKSRARIPTSATRAFDNVAKLDVPFKSFDFSVGETDLHLLDHGSSSASLQLEHDTITIDCSHEFKRWVIWSLPGKDFICLEPWSAPGNALNTGEDIITLAPAERRTLWVKIALNNEVRA